MRTLTTVETTLDIIEALVELNGAGVSELASHLELSGGGVYNHLATLHEREYLVQESEEYRLSHRFYELGQFVQQQSVLYNVAKPELERLAEAVGTSVLLVREEFGKSVYPFKATVEGSPNGSSSQLYEEGEYLHVTAGGKAILAHLPPERVEEIVQTRGLPARNSNTITDEENLLAEIAAIHDAGYAVSDEESIQGIRGIGVPILDDDGVAVGAITVSGPTSQFPESQFEQWYRVLSGVSNVIEANLATRQLSREPVY